MSQTSLYKLPPLEISNVFTNLRSYLSLLNLQEEFGGSNPIAFNEYYRGGPYVSSALAEIPSSGATNQLVGRMLNMPGYGEDAQKAAVEISKIDDVLGSIQL